MAILKTHADRNGRLIGEDCELIELGSGNAQKTRLLLEQLGHRGLFAGRYLAEPLELSAYGWRSFPDLRVLPVTAISPDRSCCRRPETPGAARCVLSWFDHRQLQSESSHRFLSDRLACGRRGRALIGFDLDKDAHIVWPAYNDQPGMSAAFNLNVLERINRELGADFDLAAFSHRADYFR